MPKLTLLVGRKPLKIYDVNATVVRIGREADLDVVIDNVAVSRRQAEIRLEGAAWILRDLGSGNGTFLNGQRVERSAPLKPGDEISFGKFTLFFERVPVEPLPNAPAYKATGFPTNGTLLLNPAELAELQKTVTQQRRAQLQWKVKGQAGTHYMTGASALVGRTELCDLRVPEGGPKQHILITREGSSFEVRNLSRWHRMQVNGRVQARAPLKSGDRIDVGALRLTFLDQIH